MATNYSDLYNGRITENLNPTAKKAYMGPEPTHAGEVIKVRAYFNLADYPAEVSNNYTVRVCEVPYLGSIIIDKVSTATNYFEPGADGRFFCSDNGVNGNTDYLAPTIDDGTEQGPFREIKCRYRNGALYYTHTTADATVPKRVTPTIVEATIRQTSGREALTEVTQTAPPIS